MAQSQWRQTSFYHVMEAIRQKKYTLLPMRVKHHVDAFGPLDEVELGMMKNEKFKIDCEGQTAHLDLLKTQEQIASFTNMIVWSDAPKPPVLDQPGNLEKAQATYAKHLKNYQEVLEGYGFISTILDAELHRAGFPLPAKPW